MGRVAGPGFAADGVGRTLVSGDVDNDGDLDLLVTNNGAAPQLLRNNNSQGNALVVRLVGVRSNRDGMGARVTVTAGGRTQVREVKSGSSYLGQNDIRAHFGLGDAARVDRLQVRWPGRHDQKPSRPPRNHPHDRGGAAVTGLGRLSPRAPARLICVREPVYWSGRGAD
jgi:hypothetical protein